MMRFFYYLGCCLGLMLLCPHSQAQESLSLPEGIWVWANEDSRETLKLEGNQVRYVSDRSLDGEIPENFMVIDQDLRANPDGKGRLVLSPHKDDDLDLEGFYVLEFQNIMEGICTFSLVPELFDTKEEAMKTQETNWYSRVFLSELGYDKAVALPTLPSPSEDDYVSMLDQIIQRLKTFKESGKQIEQNAFMISFMVEKGFNPFSSKDVFVDARRAYEGSEMVKSRFDEILRLTRLSQQD